MNFVLKKRLFVFYIIIIFSGLVSAVYYLPNSFSWQQPPVSQGIVETKASTPSLKIGDTSIAIELATTSAAIAKGLSGRDSLGENNGMLFVFSKADTYRFWMPDMRFPIDIIWINNNKVVDIDENVSNKFDRSNPVFYIPRSPAKYVLEVNATFSKNHNINIGDAVDLNSLQQI